MFTNLFVLLVISFFVGTQVGTMILQVSATDADLNPTLAYGFQYSGVREDAFSIDRYSGKILIAKRLDHETCAVYQLTVMVSPN